MEFKGLKRQYLALRPQILQALEQVLEQQVKVLEPLAQVPEQPVRVLELLVRMPEQQKELPLKVKQQRWKMKKYLRI